MIRITCQVASWPLKRPFTISRGSRTHARTIIITLQDDQGHAGRGEAVPYPRLNETPEAAMDEIAAFGGILPDALSHEDIPRLARLRCVRNALDCALWDLRARREGKAVWQLAGLSPPGPVETACTVSLAAPDEMAEEAAGRLREGMKLLKIKLGSADVAADRERLSAVREAVPAARLIVDANEGWPAEALADLLAHCAALGVEMVEQPLPEGDDGILSEIEVPSPLVICADESVRDMEDLDRLAPGYGAVNIKLDKAGGLSSALALAAAAKARGLKIMAGCMLGSSLSMAPAFLLAQQADWVDLDAPLLLADDARPSMTYQGALMQPPDPALWRAV